MVKGVESSEEAKETEVTGFSGLTYPSPHCRSNVITVDFYWDGHLARGRGFSAIEVQRMRFWINPIQCKRLHQTY